MNSFIMPNVQLNNENRMFLTEILPLVDFKSNCLMSDDIPLDLKGIAHKIEKSEKYTTAGIETLFENGIICKSVSAGEEIFFVNHKFVNGNDNLTLKVAFHEVNTQ